MNSNEIGVENAQINLYGNSSRVMSDAIDRIVVEIYNKGRKKENAQKILLTSCAPQCGSTAISIGLGISFAEARWKTLIIDCDLRRNSNYKKLNENTNIGLADFLLGEDIEGNEDFSKVVYPTNIDNLYYIPCGEYSANPTRLFCSGMMQKLLKYANDNYDYVIFDFPSIAVAPDAQILFGDVDGIILVSALEGVTKKQIREAKRKVYPFVDKYYGMIINKIDMNQYSRYVKKYDYYYLDKRGNQKLSGSVQRKYRDSRKEKKEESSHE